jgi:hypothetical protein
MGKNEFCLISSFPRVFYYAGDMNLHGKQSALKICAADFLNYIHAKVKKNPADNTLEVEGKNR